MNEEKKMRIRNILSEYFGSLFSEDDIERCLDELEQEY